MRLAGGLLLCLGPWLFGQEKVAPPALRPHGVVNAASRMPPSLAGGSIARGALFTIFGLRLGPDPSIEIRQGETVMQAAVVGGGSDRLEARMPPNAPLGRVTLSVTSNGQASAPYALTVVESSFGIFTRNGRGWGPAVADPPGAVPPGGTVMIDGTGLGRGRDVTAYLGGQRVRVLSAAKANSGAAHDRLRLRVPRNAMQGCWVPLIVSTSTGVMSNAATLAVARAGQPCQKPGNWMLDAAAPGGRRGLILLLRSQAQLTLPSGETRTFIDDQAKAFFRELKPRSGPPSQAELLPPPGACAIYAQAIRLPNLQAVLALGGAAFGGRALDAGDRLTLRGPAGEKALDKYYRDRQSYAAHLGGKGFGAAGRKLPLFLEPGNYEIGGTGGADAGSFHASVRLPAEPVWSNAGDITEVYRAQGVTLRWSQVSPEDQAAVVAVAIDQLSSSLSLCLCQASRGAGEFSIPPEALANFPGAHNAQGILPLNLLALIVTSGRSQAFQAKGLDGGVAGWAMVQAKAIDFK